jgi:uncharacterized membrane protein
MAVPRRHDITRLEAFSDAVFGFALTLLVVSLNVPQSYAELMDVMAGFPSFACCFALLIWIWHEHNTFFRRYGLHDNVVVVINAGLLFVVLFYVYPLKFMFDSMFSQFITRLHPPQPMALYQLANASIVYAIGFILMMLMFVLLYGRAYSKRSALELTDLEVFDLMAMAGHQVVSMLVGGVALAIAAFAPLTWAPYSPASLSLMGPGHFFWGWWHGHRREVLERRIAT